MTAASGPGPRDRNTDRDRDLAGASTTTSSSAGGGEAAHRAPRATSGRNTGALVAALLAGLILGGAAVALLNASSSGDDDGGDTFAGVVDTARYQAVILSNDKVYFGKLSDASSQFYELDEAFFLRETRESADAEPVRALLPVNREIHAPDNTMLIRKEEVVLVENLAKDSPILTEIKRQLNDGK